MNRESGQTSQLQIWLDRLKNGDDSARGLLIAHSCERLYKLARKLSKDFPCVRRWEETQDVVQEAALRLQRALVEVHPDTVAGFFGLATTQIRRQLIDLARHYTGPQGMGAHHSTNRPFPNSDGSERQLNREPTAGTSGPATLAEWAEFHSLIERLPLNERQVFDLHYYGGISHAEAAQLLKISEKTVKRRWISARLMLRNLMRGEFPEN